jgi:hypothetical protein
LEGIDLNADANKILATYHAGVGPVSASAGPPTYKTSEEFLAALDNPRP